MQVHRFVERSPLERGARKLTPENSRIARSVLRLSNGDPVVLLDGDGGVANGIVQDVRSKEVAVEVVSMNRSERRRPNLTLLQGLPKGDKSSFVVQKAVEFGAKSVVFFLGEHAVARAGSGQIGRWEKIAKEAMRQSGNPFLPSIVGPLPLEEALALQDDEMRIFLDECERFFSLATLTESLKEADPSSIVVAVGPEGGWGAGDRELLAKHHFRGVGIGPFVLRTESAAVAALLIGALGRTQVQ